ncbi:MAG TPA: metallophosphoesterase [Chitinophagales bacterium]|nr:metallophosphoesterase [Chitinophagales bacterium]
MRLSLIVLCLLFTYTLFAFQDSLVTRGPYLQSGTHQSMVIRWRTDSAVVCKVSYGTQPAAQTSLLEETTPTTEHEVKLNALNAFTKYYYSVYSGQALLAGGDTTYSFVTNPLPGTVQPIHLWVTGDMGKRNQQQYDVRDGYWNSIKANRHTDAWLWLGDNVYTDGTDEEYQTGMFDIYPEVLRSTVSRPCPGNHDYGAINAISNDGPYYQNFTMPKLGEAGGVPSNEEGYYSYDYGNIHFVSLNSEMLLWYISSNSQMCNWLRNDLANNQQPWVIAYWHQPPYTKGSHDSDDAFSNMSFMRTNIVPILEEYGVDIVLTGHSHNYERSYPIYGHYGTSDDFNFTMQVSATSGKPSENATYTKYTTGPNPNRGTIYIVCGNGGAVTSGEPLNHPVMYFSHQDSAGYMTIDVNGLQLDAKYYDSRGNIRDDFSITKATGPTGVVALQDLVQDLTIYPNPFSEFLHVQFSLKEKTSLAIEVLDINGKLVQTLFSGVAKAGPNKHTALINGFATGNYILRIKGEKTGSINKLVTLSR